MTLVRPAIAPARLVIRGARVLDPREAIDGVFDLVVLDGRLVELAPAGSAGVPDDAEIIEGEGRHVLPAFVDPHVHLRVPGQ
jgi:dihydroorotase